MKIPALVFACSAFVAVITPPSYAQTDFLVKDGNITNAANWSAGLPTTPENPGTIAIDGKIPATSSVNWTLYITQTAGTLLFTGTGSEFKLVGGSFTQDGGTWANNAERGFYISSSNITTIISGTVNSGAKGHTTIQSGASMTVNGGTFAQFGSTRQVYISDGGKLIVNGGTVQAIAVTNTTSAKTGGILAFNGGTTTANNFNFARASSVTFGGTSAGSVTAGTFTGATFDWLTGTHMSLTLTNTPGVWAEAEWDADRLLFNGQAKTALGKTWAEVTALGGLGPKTYFNFTGTTLSLVTITYPPGTLIRFQ